MSNWFYNSLQRVRFRWLVFYAVLLTVSFACGYRILDASSPENGLHRSEWDKNASWYDYVYFSIVTETTLGYGDIAPRGLSRLMACTQVSLGVLIAGIAVARLTSAAINRLAEIRYATKGVWVDILTVPNEPTWLGVVEFVLDGGSILFRGDNYSIAGVHQHSFSCRLIHHEWPNELVFRYQEAQGHLPLQKGFTTMTFSDWRGYHPQGYWVTIEDIPARLQITGQGWKVTQKKWRKALNLPERPASTIQEIYAHYLPKITERPPFSRPQT